MRLSKAAIVLALFKGSNAACPFAKKVRSRRLQQQQSIHHSEPAHRALQGRRTGDGGVPAAGYDAVKNDIINLLTASQDFWPSDFADTVGANYGPFMIRLAWHCSGSYRATDGRGGCDGGRIRHDPELNWPDNANLDKALQLLEPIKEKYGTHLSWGDLVVLAGNAAIESMGGPILGFCGGRIDDFDGSSSLVLGPSAEQEELTPCINDGKQGACTGNLGPTTVGLIYVNPAGHLGNPDPAGLILNDIRSSFGKMGMNDTETLALTGGGHSFGKCHGACKEAPCGDGEMVGKGLNTFTSGFEGAWTTAPTTWTNQYFTNLFDFDWKNITGPGGNPQWAPAAKNGVDPVPDIMMLTSDIALTKDPEFLKISQEFAGDISKLEMQFKHAWYKLTASDMGPVTRCLGDSVPPAQLFQSPLPGSPDTLPDFIPIRQKIQGLIENEKSNREAFVSLASKCASTFRVTDYQGGCNGAYVRFDDDAETKDTIKTLSAIKDDYPNASYADIIVLAAQVALEDAGSYEMAFCGGRTDATDNNRAHLKPIVYDSRLSAAVKYKDAISVQGLTFRQGVALAGIPSGSGDMDNEFFEDLMKAADEGNQGTYTDKEWALVEDDELKTIVKLYAENMDEFMDEFTSAWSYLMAADRFDGPRLTACSGVISPTLLVDAGDTSTLVVSGDTSTIVDAGDTSAAASGTSIASVAIGSVLGAVGVLAIM
mmetsp:Transcript_16013/g.34643  ORF Transcript_16013/g.34643 Transcript_16013/m.34643 type:complete len:711 (-) Transcript_16013:92-2224(-)|eukprot:CAMPEP_0172312012 /NCGR_PEP_ID=MMETSP1058-20130122/16389_1 /TAXON_ID=83371 /ORGANISM="Detonula confervacea, Strain CCMP 353" /LENGTH=710 /DNA_ID=CAMNT_0013025353 /DNA_START=224 /DNA_END=2356 /DNA_ORIENTATION=-